MAEEKDRADAPAKGSARSDEQARRQRHGKNVQVRESADEHEELPDALGNKLERVPAGAAPDASQNSETETGAFGIALSAAAGEIDGGNIKAVLESPDNTALAQRPLVREQAAMMSPIGKQIAGLLGRPVTEWGIIGPGDTVRGHMLLLDLNTGEKVRAMDGHRVQAGELYMNLRNAPESLATGDTIEKVLGA